MDIPQLIFSLILIIIGGFMVGLNMWIFIETIVLKNQWISPVPVVGGLFMCAGIILYPIEGSSKYSWIPILIDWGGLPAFVTAYFQGVFSRKR